MNCKFRKKYFTTNKVGKSTYYCIYCDLKVTTKSPAHRIFSNCPSNGKVPYIRKIRNYLLAVSNMILYRNKYGGFARSKKEILKNYEICSACEFFNKDRCSRCGCRVSKSINPFTNKIAMKSQSCPEGKW